MLSQAYAIELLRSAPVHFRGRAILFCSIRVPPLAELCVIAITRGTRGELTGRHLFRRREVEQTTTRTAL
jgi:hypothetical protein